MQPASTILNDLIERVRTAQFAFVGGDSRPYEELFEQSDDASLTGPFGGPTICGWIAIQPRMRRAASFFKGPAESSQIILQSATVGADLIVLRLAEHNRVRFAGQDDVVDWDLRVTLVFRKSANTWLVLHRHADPLFELNTSHRPA